MADAPRLTDEQRARTRRWVAMLDDDRATLRDEVEQDVAQYRDLPPERAAELRHALIEAGWRWLQARPDKEAVLAYRDPPAPDFEQVWSRLVEQGRRLRATRGDSNR